MLALMLGAPLITAPVPVGGSLSGMGLILAAIVWSTVSNCPGCGKVHLSQQEVANLRASGGACQRCGLRMLDVPSEERTNRLRGG